MLVLSRKPNECVLIDSKVTVKVLCIQGNKVRLGIDAPFDVAVDRLEVHEKMQIEAIPMSVG